MEREKGLVIDGEGECHGGGDDGRGGVAGRRQQQELLGVKLRRGLSVVRRGGTYTPVPSWKVEEEGTPGEVEGLDHFHHPLSQHHRRSNVSNAAGSVAMSARKLAANLWEFQDLLPVSATSRKDGGGRMHSHHHQRGCRHMEHGAFDLGDSAHGCSHDRPQSAGNLRRKHLTTLLIQHHHNAVKKNSQALQPGSPESYSSSMEVTAYNQAMTPTSSLSLKGRLGESGYRLQTSTELLKVLNRIWSLEEQHASNISIMKALKLELEHARARIQGLIQERQADRHEIDDLLRQLAEEKLLRKKKERERIKITVQSLRDELEDEMRLRRHSESQHRKLAKEFAELKISHGNALKDIKRERQGRALLEDLCDELAKGIGDYEQEVRELKQKSVKDFDRKCNPLVLHISEAWLDERLQMKLAESRGDFNERNTIVDKLGCEVESFLRATQTNIHSNGIHSPKYDNHHNLHRQSLESLHFNGVTSAPNDAEDDDSVASDLHCFELDMRNDDQGLSNYRLDMSKCAEIIEEAKKSVCSKKKLRSNESTRAQYSSGITEHFQEQMGNGGSSARSKAWLVGKPSGAHNRGEIEGKEAHQSEFVTIKSEGHESGECSHTVDDNTKGRSTASEVSKILQPPRGQGTTINWEKTSADVDRAANITHQWSHNSDIEIAESSSKLPQGVKENTLKAKLLEARLEGQHARMRSLKGPSLCR